MKTSSDDLFRLIKSLNKNEKRYFKLYASRNVLQGKNNYLLLFDAIDEQSASGGEYDEASIVQQFKKETFSRYMASTKYHMQNLILKSLHAYHAESSVDSRLLEMLHTIEILQSKGLYDLCRKQIKVAKKLAADHEKFTYLINLMRTELNVLRILSDYKEISAGLGKWHKEMTLATKKIQNYNDQLKINSEMHSLLKLKGLARSIKEKEQYKKVKSDPLLKNEEGMLSMGALRLFYNTHGTYHFALGEADKVYNYARKLLKLKEEEMQSGKAEAGEYVADLYNYAINAIQTKKTEEFFATLKKMRSIKIDDDTQRARAFTMSYNVEFEYYSRSGNFSEGAVRLQVFEKEAATVKDKNKALLLVTFFQAACIDFGAGNYSRSLKWINKILNNKDVSIREDIHCIARMVDLIIHFELGNEELLEYKIKSAHRFLRKKEKYFEMENILLVFIQNIRKNYTKEGMKKSLLQLKEGILEIADKYPEEKFLNYFDFTAWIDSKLENISFAEAVKRKLKSETLHLPETV